MAEEKTPAKEKEIIKIKKGMKKSFFEVKAPLVSAKIALYAYVPEELVGKVAKLDLTRNLKGKNFELKLRVAKDNMGGLVGEPVSLELAQSYIRRMMRAGIDYVEDSFVSECKNCKARVKVFLIARNKVSRAVRKALRETGRKFLEGYLKARDASEVFSDMTSNKIQKEMFARLKKIYPLALCEVKGFIVE